jgi:hypothetical protein
MVGCIYAGHSYNRMSLPHASAAAIASLEEKGSMGGAELSILTDLAAMMPFHTLSRSFSAALSRTIDAWLWESND